MPPLHNACRDGDAAKAAQLIQDGADLEAKDWSGFTPLHWAVYGGEVECVKVLVEARANNEAKSNIGETPLHKAAFYGKVECMQVLLRARANKEAKDDLGKTPLHAAAYYSKVECVKVLMEAGANKEAKSNGGRTPLDLARDKGHSAVVELLNGPQAAGGASMPPPAPPARNVRQRTDAGASPSAAPAAADEPDREMEAVMYESALSHLRKQLYLKFCVVCLTEPRETVFVHPNGIEHALCCADCARELQRQRQPCPICRQPLGRLERADGPVDRTVGAPRPGRRAAALDATQLPNMPWAIDASQAVQLRAKEPAVATDSPPELELELRTDEEEYLIGGGAFGAVYVGRRRGVRLAAKTFHAIANPAVYGLSNPANLNGILQEIMREVNALIAVDHVHIIHFAGVAFSTRNRRTLPKWILSEFAAGGTLHARIYEGQPLSEELITKYTKETMSALEYLHDNVNMVHCDMKPKNVLLSIDGRIKIADLGITKVVQRIDTLTNRGTMTMCGTPIYMAPECAASEAYTASRDIYAWGLIIAEMLLKEEPPPFGGTAPRPPHYQFGPGHEEFVKRAAPRAGGLRQIMINCTKEHSQQRPTAAQVLARLR